MSYIKIKYPDTLKKKEKKKKKSLDTQLILTINKKKT